MKKEEKEKAGKEYVPSKHDAAPHKTINWKSPVFWPIVRIYDPNTTFCILPGLYRTLFHLFKFTSLRLHSFRSLDMFFLELDFQHMYLMFTHSVHTFTLCPRFYLQLHWTHFNPFSPMPICLYLFLPDPVLQLIYISTCTST
jgi:hypothetical protein